MTRKAVFDLFLKLVEIVRLRVHRWQATLLQYSLLLLEVLRQTASDWVVAGLGRLALLALLLREQLLHRELSGLRHLQGAKISALLVNARLIAWFAADTAQLPARG